MLFVKICADNGMKGRGIHYIPEDKKAFSFRNTNNFRIFHKKFNELYTLMKLWDPNWNNMGW